MKMQQKFGFAGLALVLFSLCILRSFAFSNGYFGLGSLTPGRDWGVIELGASD